MKIRLEEIRYPAERMRKVQNYSGLRDSMRDNGQLQPIIVRLRTKEAELDGEGKYDLVAGLHRLLSAWDLRHAGHEDFAYIWATVFPCESDERQMLIEVDENLQRAELTAMERAEHLYLRKHLMRQLGCLTKPGRPKGSPKRESQENPANSAGLTLEVVEAPKVEAPKVKTAGELAASLGVSERKLRLDTQIIGKIHPLHRRRIENTPWSDNQRELLRLARREPKEQAIVTAIWALRHRAGMRPMGVQESLRYYQRLETEGLAREVAEPTGKYRCIVVDPPWSGEDSGDVGGQNGKLAPAYATMTAHEMKDLPVADLACEDDCHLYLWVTNRTMRHGFDLMDAWGFRHATILTWVKHRMGTGRYFRNTTEHVLFGVKGTRVLARTDAPTHFEAPRRAHSEKPDAFYDLVESVSPGPFIELFARRERDNWQSWGTLEQRDKEAV